MKSTKYIFIFLVLLFIFLGSVFINSSSNKKSFDQRNWKFQSIDTMKYSRDLSREKLYDETFDIVIDEQVRNIANTGATHVAIGTPYDKEFLPMLSRWVKAARKYHLKVWFRGNFSGWEKWFGYSPISREQHKELTREFILSNKDLFEDGDIFTPCPECENGGPGDPRHTGDTSGHRKFLIEEHEITSKAFDEIGINVINNINSMNGDVAKLIMDPSTTKSLGGVVAVDHYVGDAQQLVSDIKEYARLSGGKVVLSEFGAPIPDLNGNMTEDEQSVWIDSAFSKMIGVPELKGVNYWVNVGGSTHLWNDDGSPRKAVDVITKYYKPKFIQFEVKNEIGEGLRAVVVKSIGKEYKSDKIGKVLVPYYYAGQEYIFNAKDYIDKTINIPEYTNSLNVVLQITKETKQFQLRKIILNLFK